MPELVCAADDSRWHDERRKGVTATDITAIMGLSPCESEYSLYWKKLGHIPDAHEDNDRLRLGRDLEPLIIGRWLENTRGHSYRQPKLWRSSARVWQMATPDALVYATDEYYQVNGVLELKSWADADRHTWGAGELPEPHDAEWAAERSKIPPRVRAQVLWQMDTLDVAAGHVGVLFLPSGEFRSYVIEHDPECPWPEELGCDLDADIFLMRQAGEEFMARLRLELPPPSPDATSATLAALKARFRDARKGKEAEVDAGLWNEYEWACKGIAGHELLKRSVEAQLREQIGDATILTVGGVKVATRVTGDAQVKAHTRHQDYIRRTKTGDDDGS